MSLSNQMTNKKNKLLVIILLICNNLDQQVLIHGHLQIHKYFRGMAIKFIKVV